MTEENKNNGHLILIVDDERSLLKALMEKFAKEGFRTLTAENGEKGLKLALEEKPEIILLDIVMPNMDGIEMAKRLKEKGISIPIIFLTNIWYFFVSLKCVFHL